MFLVILSVCLSLVVNKAHCYNSKTDGLLYDIDKENKLKARRAVRQVLISRQVNRYQPS